LIAQIGWQVGQSAVIDRRQIVTIERVTASGLAIVAGRKFSRDGKEITKSTIWDRSRLEPMTPDIESEIDLVRRGNDAKSEAYKAIVAADKWLRTALGFPNERRVPDAATVVTAERLAVALRQAVEGT
jgi:hypothetical protein